MSLASPKVVILLATRNGAAFLQEQLDSYRTQTYQNWELVVSDDGSTDDTIKIIEEFAKQVPQRVVVRRGPQIGFWQNFVSLVRSDDIDGDLFAYSDQDDVWFPEKLAKAVSWFEARPTDQPAVYFTRTELMEESGAPIGFSPLFVRAPTFQNALVQNIGGGNTMVFNRAARLALRATPADVALVSHDWWTYQVVTGIGGTAHYDPWPSLRYRQHGLNLVGANKGLWARLVRIIGIRVRPHGDVERRQPQRAGQDAGVLHARQRGHPRRFCQRAKRILVATALSDLAVRRLPAKHHREYRAFCRGSVRPSLEDDTHYALRCRRISETSYGVFDAMISAHWEVVGIPAGLTLRSSRLMNGHL